MDRLETVLKRFETAIIHGPGGTLLRNALTPKADVGDVTLIDELEGPGVDVVAPADALPLPSGYADLIVSMMALHAVSDLPGALVEARRVLKPDGLFIGIFPGERTLHELRSALQTAEAAVTGRVAPRVLPFVAVKDGGALLQRAGFALPVADVIRTTVEYESPLKLMAELRGAGETSHLVAGSKGALRRDVIAKMAEIYKTEFGRDDGYIPATIDLVTVTGWAPHQSQPKPLKPGSGKVSLAEAVQRSDQ